MRSVRGIQQSGLRAGVSNRGSSTHPTDNLLWVNRRDSTKTSKLKCHFLHDLLHMPTISPPFRLFRRQWHDAPELFPVFRDETGDECSQLVVAHLRPL